MKTGLLEVSTLVKVVWNAKCAQTGLKIKIIWCKIRVSFAWAATKTIKTMNTVWFAWKKCMVNGSNAIMHTAESGFTLYVIAISRIRKQRLLLKKLITAVLIAGSSKGEKYLYGLWSNSKVLISTNIFTMHNTKKSLDTLKSSKIQFASPKWSKKHLKALMMRSLIWW